MARVKLLGSLFLFFFISTATSQHSLPLPSALQSISPTLSIYSPAGSPQCFVLDGGRSSTTKDLARIAEGHGAWKQASRIILVTHGFRDSIDSPWMHQLKNAMQSQLQHQTVILVGWGEGSGATQPDIKYKKAAANIKTVGDWLGDVVAEMRKINPDMFIWGIGHSLGAHLMGVAARKSTYSFNRITALDPAGPFLENNRNPDITLRRSDAPLVDVIHADGCSEQLTRNCWVAPNNHYGTLVPLGTLDFYPNYGLTHPETHPLDIHRSHRRAVDLFLLSVKNRGLFQTNDTLDGSPGLPGSSVIPIKQTNVVAEMGYFSETAFIPGPTDSRVNFYIGKDIMSVVERLRDSDVNLHARHRRDLAKAIECTKVPAKASLTHGNKGLLFIFFTLWSVCSLLFL